MITGEKMSGLSESEVHNILLMEVHNRLAEISRFLEVFTAHYANLDSIDVETITRDHQISMHCLSLDCPEEDREYTLRINDYRPIGYTADKGLHIAEDDNDFYQLSNKATARPVDDDNYFLTDEGIENRWGKEVLMAIKKWYNHIFYSRKKTSE